MLRDIDEKTWKEKREAMSIKEPEYTSAMDKRSPIGHYYLAMLSEDWQDKVQALCHVMLRATSKGVVCSFKSVDVDEVNGKPGYGSIMVYHMLSRILERHPEVYVVQAVCKTGETKMIPYFVENGFHPVSENGNWSTYGKNV